MTNNSTFPISIFNSIKDKTPKSENSDFLIKLINNPSVGSIKENNKLFAPVKFNGTRSIKNALEASALVLDYDSKEINIIFDKEIKCWENLECSFFAYTTFSHTEDKHCFRIIISLKEPIPNNEYSKLWNWAYNITQQKIDKSCKDISRISYLPKHKQDAPYRTHFFEGTLLDWKNLPLIMANEVKQEQSAVNHNKTKYEYKETISDNDPIWLYIAKLPESIEGCHGHNDLMRCAYTLVQGFGLSINDAMPYFQKWNDLKARPPESYSQLEHKLSDAFNTSLPEGKQKGWLKLDSSKKNKATRATESNLQEHKIDDLDFAIEFTNSYPDIKFDEKNNVWRLWSNTHWKEIESIGFIKEIIQDVIRDTNPGTFISSKKVESIYKLIQTKARASFKQKDNLLNFLNGTLNLEESDLGKLNPNNKEDFFINYIPYKYYPFLTTPNIDKFLEETFENQEDIKIYMTHIGLALMKDKSFHKALILIGKPRSGKTTAIALANLVCGLSKLDAYTFASASLFDRASEGYRARATWNNKLLVCVDELPTEAFRNEETLKCMIAHSGVGMRQIYKTEETNNRWLPKLFFTTNDTPTIKDFSNAIAHRLMVLRCPKQKKTSKKDLLDSFILELGAFAFNCLDYAKQALDSGYYPSEIENRNTVEEISLFSNPIKQFVKDYCIIDKDSWAASNELFQAYKHFCEQEEIKHLTKGWLIRKLVDMVDDVQPIKQNDIRGLQGIKINPKINLETDAPVTFYKSKKVL